MSPSRDNGRTRCVMENDEGPTHLLDQVKRLFAYLKLVMRSGRYIRIIMS